MARKRKRAVKGLPWYWAKRDVWVTPGCPKKSSVKDEQGRPVRGEDNRAAALEAWHKSRAAEPVEPGPVGTTTVYEVLGLFLNHVRRENTPKTYAEYTAHFRSFDERWPGLAAADLRPEHVRTWWEEKEWSTSTRNHAGSALKAAFRWASEPGLGGRVIGASPLAGMRLPPMRKRTAEVLATDHQYFSLLAVVPPAVWDVLVVLWCTGTRPVNLWRAEAAHVDPAGPSLVFDGHNTPAGSTVHKTWKATGRALKVPLPTAAWEVVSRLAVVNPTGPLFRTTRGGRWTTANFDTLLAHHRKKVGLTDFTGYTPRHTRATRLLQDGVSLSDVAAILGNSARTVDGRYGHVTSDQGRLATLLTAKLAGSGSVPAVNAAASGPAAEAG